MTTKERVLELVAQGVPRMAIAERLGLSRQRVYKISPAENSRPKRQVLIELARGLLAAGLSIPVAAAAIGCSRNTLWAWGLRAIPQERKPRHGTATEYNAGCRCKECRAANTRRVSERKSRLNPAYAPHGTASGYVNWNCRCDACKDAGSAANSARRLRREARQAGRP